MKIIVDECIAFSTKKLLITYGFEVLTIDDILKSGIEDELIYEYASKAGISILTHDRRFGRIYFDSTSNPTTTLILKIIDPHPQATNRLLQTVLSQINLQSEKYYKKLVIIDTKSVRIRSKSNH